MKTKTKHWRVGDPNKLSKHGGAIEFKFDVFAGDELLASFGGPQGKANARLIASAPDLLAAAVEAKHVLCALARHQAFEGDALEFNEGGIGYEAIELLQAAIAKVEEAA